MRIYVVLASPAGAAAVLEVLLSEAALSFLAPSLLVLSVLSALFPESEPFGAVALDLPAFLLSVIYHPLPLK